MNLALMSLIGAGAFALYKGSKKHDNNGNYFLEKIARPLYSLFVEYHSNNLFQIDYIKEDHIICNTMNDKVFGIEILGNENIQNFLHKEVVDSLIRDNKDNDDAFLYYVFHKQGKF